MDSLIPIVSIELLFTFSRSGVFKPVDKCVFEMIDPQSGWNEDLLCLKSEKTELLTQILTLMNKDYWKLVIFQSPNYRPTFHAYLNNMAVSPSQTSMKGTLKLMGLFQNA